MRTESGTVVESMQHEMQASTGAAEAHGEPVAEAGPAGLDTPGTLVRERREAAGLALPDVADALHLTVHYIKALENDDYAKLPGLTFVKGYFRAYARHLGMDTEALLENYEHYLQQREDLVAQQAQVFRMRRRNDQAVIWAMLAGAVLVVGLAAGWWWFGREASTAAVLPDPATERVFG